MLDFRELQIIGNSLKQKRRERERERKRELIHIVISRALSLRTSLASFVI